MVTGSWAIGPGQTTIRERRMKHTDPAKLSESTRNDGLNLNRRSLLKNSLLGAAGLAFGGLASRDLMAASLPYSPNYGPNPSSAACTPHYNKGACW